MLTCFCQTNCAEYIFSILRLHVVSVIHDLSEGHILFNESVVGGVHIHCDCLYLTQIVHVSLFKEALEILHGAPMPDPDYIPFGQVNDACRIAMAFMDGKFIYCKIFRLVPLSFQLLLTLSVLIFKNFYFVALILLAGE